MSDNKNRTKIDLLWDFGCVDHPSLINFGSDSRWHNKDFQDSLEYAQNQMYKLCGIPSELVMNSKNENMKVNYPIGAEVYVLDNSYAKNMNTGRNDIWVAGSQGKKGPKCKVQSTPFTAVVDTTVAGLKEREMVLVKPDGAFETYMVLNALEDASKIRVQLNEHRIAEVNHSAKTIKVGCQTITFDKVRELYEVIFAYRKPEPIDESRIKSDMHRLRMDWDRMMFTNNSEWRSLYGIQYPIRPAFIQQHSMLP